MNESSLNHFVANLKIFIQLKKNEVILFAHYVVCSVGLVGITLRAGNLLGNVLSMSYYHGIHYNNWARLATLDGKLGQLLAYAGCVAVLFLYFGFINTAIRSMRPFRSNMYFSELNTTFSILSYLVLLSLSNGYLLYQSMKHGKLFVLTLSSMIWLFMFLLPLIQRKLAKSIIKVATYLFILAMLVDMWFLFMPYLVPDSQFVSNDYLDIQEKTILSNGQVVDNTDFVNAHHLGGMVRYYLNSANDIAHQDKLIHDIDYIRVIKSASLDSFISHNPYKFHYSDEYQGLFVDGRLTEDEKEALCASLHDRQACHSIAEYYTANLLRSSHVYSEVESDFFEKNMYELQSQLRPGAYFHHHNALLGAINSYDLGKPLNQSIMFYGWLPTVVVSFLMTLMGGFSISHYITVTYSFYLIYYTLIPVIAYLIFRHRWYVALITAASLASLYAISFEAIRIAPGFNPVRHIFDLFVIMFLYLHFNSKNHQNTHLIFATIFLMISYITNHEFGMMMILAFVVSLVTRILIERRIQLSEVLSMTALAMCLIAVPFIIPVANNPLAIYNLSGTFVPFTAYKYIAIPLLVFAATYVILFLIYRANKSELYFPLFLFCYGQGALFYFVWNPSFTHLYSMIFPWLFLAVIILKKLWETMAPFTSTNRVFLPLLTIVVLLFYVPSRHGYVVQQNKYYEIIKDHTLFNWNITTAHITSTMDPKAFEESIAMINKYAIGNGIYMVSKYENILLSIARKYSQFPYLQLDISLVTPKESRAVVDQMLNDKPRYIFVDSDIGRSHHADGININDSIMPAFNEKDIHIRELMLDNLAAVFAEISPHYRMIERGSIISTYELID